MSEPTTVNLKLTQGDDISWTLTFSEDLVAFEEIWMTFRENYATTEVDDSSAVAQAKLTAGSIVVTGARTAVASLSHSATAAFGKAEYVHDVQVRRVTSGKLHTTQRGPVRVKGDVTRST